MASLETIDYDAVLIERIADRDHAAFEELYERFARPVLAMGIRHLGNSRAEEATQETFAAIWRSARTYRRGRGAASAWLYAIARHAIVDCARRRLVLVPLPEPHSTNGDMPEEHAEAAWEAWRVHAAMLQLPERERLVLELGYWKGLSQVEIADELELPLGTVKSRTRAGLARLANLLEEEASE